MHRSRREGVSSRRGLYIHRHTHGSPQLLCCQLAAIPAWGIWAPQGLQVLEDKDRLTLHKCSAGHHMLGIPVRGYSWVTMGIFMPGLQLLSNKQPSPLLPGGLCTCILG